MTNPTQTNRPVVKATNPELYVQHTYRMQKARKYTYNYSSLDDYIVENWDTKSIQQIADETNEYFNRVVYRVQILQSLKLLKNKRNMERGKLMRQRKHLITWLKEVDAKPEGVA